MTHAKSTVVIRSPRAGRGVVGFETIVPESRAFLRDWVPGSGAENSVVSATIKATKPKGTRSCCGPSCCPQGSSTFPANARLAHGELEARLRPFGARRVTRTTRGWRASCAGSGGFLGDSTRSASARWCTRRPATSSATITSSRPATRSLWGRSTSRPRNGGIRERERANPGEVHGLACDPALLALPGSSDPDGAGREDAGASGRGGRCHGLGDEVPGPEGLGTVPGIAGGVCQIGLDPGRVLDGEPRDGPTPDCRCG
jgi:hypothetical protein